MINLVLVGCYTATLVWVKNGSRYPFVMFLILMLIASNICSIFVVWCDQKIWEWDNGVSIDHIYLWNWFVCIMAVTRDVTFNVSHWMLAFEYLKIAKFMPITFKEK